MAVLAPWLLWPPQQAGLPSVFRGVHAFRSHAHPSPINRMLPRACAGSRPIASFCRALVPPYRISAHLAPRSIAVGSTRHLANTAAASAATPASRAATAMPADTGPVAALQGLQPEALWRHFGELSKIPRPSKHEDRCVCSTS